MVGPPISRLKIVDGISVYFQDRRSYDPESYLAKYYPTAVDDSRRYVLVCKRTRYIYREFSSSFKPEDLVSNVEWDYIVTAHVGNNTVSKAIRVRPNRPLTNWKMKRAINRQIKILRD